MKLGIVGSRTFTDYELFYQYLDSLNRMWGPFEEIVSGGANGADTLAERYADDKKILLKVFKPDWKSNGKSAGFIRNIQIVERSDLIIAFWDGKSLGTKDSIDKARTLKRPTLIVYV